MIITLKTQNQSLEIGQVTTIRGKPGRWKVLRFEGDFTYVFEQMPNRKERRKNDSRRANRRT